MDFVKLIPIILSLVSSGGKYAEIIRKALELIALIIGTDTIAPVMDARWAQGALKQLGFDPGPIDGQMGPRTQAAIKAYQTARGLEPDGWLGVATQTKLAQEVPPT